MNRIHRSPLRAALAVAFLLGHISACFASDSNAIRPWSKNPWYWSHKGEPVLLIGGSDDDNLFQWPSEQLIPQLDRLAGAGGNVIRNTMSDRQDKGFELYPFRRLASGKHDLDQWNDAYWNRFEFMLAQTAKRDIVVQIEIWDRFDYTDKGGENHWQRHPCNPKNNVNYTYEASSFAKRYSDHPGANKQPFFFTTPKQRNNKVVLKYQEAFVNKLLDHSLKYGHVLYCMDNETKAEPAWGEHWAWLIKRRAKAAGRTVQVTEMWDAWNLQSNEHKQTFDRPELYDFVDVSQNNHNKGRKHWDNFRYVRQYLVKQPRPMNTTKTYGADGNKFGHSDQDAVERFWRHLLAGVASARFHRPDSGLGLNDKAVNCLKTARRVEALVPFWELRPAMQRLVAGGENDAYIAEARGRAVVVFLPGGKKVTVDLNGFEGAREFYWTNIAEGINGPMEKMNVKGPVKLQAPGPGNWVIVVK
jgi:hypothetical protein